MESHNIYSFYGWNCHVVWPFAEQYNEFLEANRYENQNERDRRLLELLDALPDCNYNTLKCLMQHLNCIASHREDNKVVLHALF